MSKTSRRFTLCLHSVHCSCVACRPWNGCGVVSGLSVIIVSCSSESRQAAKPSGFGCVVCLCVRELISETRNSWLSCCSKGLDHLGWRMWSINLATVDWSEKEDDCPLIERIRSRRICATVLFWRCCSIQRIHIEEEARHWTIAFAKQLFP